MKKILFLRHAAQLLFLTLLLLGLRETIAPFLVVFFLLSFLAGNFFCGWLCPLGAIQEFASKTRSLITKKSLKLPAGIQRYAQYSRYIIAAYLILLMILKELPAGENGELPVNAYKILIFFIEGIPISTAALGFLAFVLALALVTDRPFCNYMCTKGLEYAIPSSLRIFTVKRDFKKCVDCEACDRACPMHIQISEVHELRHLHCINCFECIAACPLRDSLSYGKANVTIRLLRYKFRNFLRVSRRGKRR